jgi:hypothetical protein
MTDLVYVTDRDDGLSRVGSGKRVRYLDAAGDRITDEAQAYACRFPAAGVVVGATPLVTDGMENLVDALLKGDAPACQG